MRYRHHIKNNMPARALLSLLDRTFQALSRARMILPGLARYRYYTAPSSLDSSVAALQHGSHTEFYVAHPQSALDTVRHRVERASFVEASELLPVDVDQRHRAAS